MTRELQQNLSIIPVNKIKSKAVLRRVGLPFMKKISLVEIYVGLDTYRKWMRDPEVKSITTDYEKGTGTMEVLGRN